MNVLLLYFSHKLIINVSLGQIPYAEISIYSTYMIQFINVVANNSYF